MRRTFMLALVVLGGCDRAETVDAGPRDIDAARPDVGIDAGTTERDAGARTELDADTESGLDAMAEGGSAGEVDADSDGGLDASHDVGWYPFGISDAELVFDDPSLTCTPIDYTFRSPRPTVPAGTVLWTTELPPFLPIATDRLTTRLIDPSGQVILHPSGSVSVQTLYPRGIATFDREGHFRSEREYSRNEPSWRFRSIGDDRILDPETAPEGPPGIPSRSPSRAGAILPNGTAWSMAEGETLAPGFHQLYLHIWCAREHQTKRVWRMEVGRAAPDIRATETEVMVGGSTLTHRFTHDGEYLGRREHEGLSETFSYNARCGWTTRDEPRWLEMDLSTVRYPIVMSSRVSDRWCTWTSDCGAYLTDFERISPSRYGYAGCGATHREQSSGASMKPVWLPGG